MMCVLGGAVYMLVLPVYSAYGISTIPLRAPRDTVFSITRQGQGYYKVIMSISPQNLHQGLDKFEYSTKMVYHKH